jgi:hypothetical protein
MVDCRERNFLASQVILRALQGCGYSCEAIAAGGGALIPKLDVDLKLLAQGIVRPKGDSACDDSTSDSGNQQESRKRSLVDTEKARKRHQRVGPDPALENSSSLESPLLSLDRPLGLSATPEQFSQDDQTPPVPRLNESVVNQSQSQDAEQQSQGGVEPGTKATPFPIALANPVASRRPSTQFREHDKPTSR